MKALWGKLSCEILTQNWDAALEDLIKLKELIDNGNTSSPANFVKSSTSSNALSLYSRAWLIHWSLFVFFNHPKGRDSIIDMLFQPAYINTIQTACPWVLRCKFLLYFIYPF